MKRDRFTFLNQEQSLPADWVHPATFMDDSSIPAQLIQLKLHRNVPYTSMNLIVLRDHIRSEYTSDSHRHWDFKLNAEHRLFPVASIDCMAFQLKDLVMGVLPLIKIFTNR